MTRGNLTLSCLISWSLLCANSASALQIEFDYSYDTAGFFTELSTGSPISERREILEYAASFYTGFTDNLTAITPTTSDSWSVSIINPGQLGSIVTLDNLTISEDTLRIYVGGSPSAPGVLGFAGTGFDVTTSGSEQFNESVNTRGQNGDDYGVWGGYIWFNSNNNWYFGEDESGLSTSTPDFFTTAVHEIAHILGFGEAQSWFSNIENGLFYGEQATAIYGSAVPVDQYGAHWAEGTMSVYNGVAQETLLDPSTPLGERQYLTELDYAGFADMGWEVAPVPIPASIYFLLAAMTTLLNPARSLRK